MKLNNIDKILFITLSNIGDVILTLPVLSALKDNFRNARIDVVVGPRPKGVFTKDPGISSIFVYDKKASLGEKLSFIKRLRNQKYDLAIDMRQSLIPFLIGARNRTPLISSNNLKVRHKRLAHLDRLKGFDMKYSKSKRPNIYIDDKDRERVARLLECNGAKKGELLIGISPASRSPLKRWRTGGFIELADSLVRRGGCKIILIGEDSEADVSRDIVNAVKHKSLIDFTGKLDLNELFALIERFSVLLTCDSACMHIACELGVKVVAIFGPTDHREYGPTGKDDIVIRKDIGCAPCKKAVCALRHECMEEIDPKEVLDAVRRLLGW